MKCQHLCPFYGRNPDCCDIGCGYISPYHVETMVRYCTSHYQNCGKYQELLNREQPSEEADKKNQQLAKQAAPSGGLMFPVALDSDTFTAVQHALRTPLTSIISFSEILLQHPIDDPQAQRQFLRAIHDEAQRLNQALSTVFSDANAARSSAAAVKAKQKTEADRVPDPA